jgi:hypothetical protein
MLAVAKRLAVLMFMLMSFDGGVDVISAKLLLGLGLQRSLIHFDRSK